MDETVKVVYVPEMEASPRSVESKAGGRWWMLLVVVALVGAVLAWQRPWLVPLFGPGDDADGVRSLAGLTRAGFKGLWLRPDGTLLVSPAERHEARALLVRQHRLHRAIAAGRTVMETRWIRQLRLLAPVAEADVRLTPTPRVTLWFDPAIPGADRVVPAICDMFDDQVAIVDPQGRSLR